MFHKPQDREYCSAGVGGGDWTALAAGAFKAKLSIADNGKASPQWVARRDTGKREESVVRMRALRAEPGGVWGDATRFWRGRGRDLKKFQRSTETSGAEDAPLIDRGEGASSALP